MTDMQTMPAPRTHLTDADRTVGDIWWLDLATSDKDLAKTFYTGLLGWTYEDSGEEFGSYTMVKQGDSSVAGMMAQSEDMKKMGAPSAWTPYISVQSATDTVAKAKQLGANVFVDAMQVGDIGWMAILADPTGAVFGIWQALTFSGADLINSPGALCWTEARSTDVPAAKEFYTKLFGWSIESMDMGGMPYTQFMLDGHPVAGLMGLEGEMAGVPSHWGVTLAVAKLDTALSLARDNGGKVTFEPMTIPFGKLAGIVDPTGAAVNLIELAPVNQG